MATLLSTTVNGTINSTGNTTAAGFTGNANVAGTGAATYHPSGIYSTGTNWLYGTMYLNGNDVYDINGIRAFYFYDRADTSYYTRPSSTSRVYHIHADHLSIGQGINTSYRVITNGDYYANGGGNFWAEGRFKQYRGSGTWHDVIDSGNIGSQSVNYAASAGSVAWTNVSSRPTALSQFSNDLGNYGGWITSSGSISGSAGSVPASGITGQTGMWTSSARPGPYRLYRNEDNSAYNVQTTWSADVSGYWSLRGYLNDSYHAPCYVGYAGYAPSAGNADTVDGYHASGLLKLNEWNGNVYLHTDGRIYGTIFYDANNDGYYLNPNGTSSIVNLHVQGGGYASNAWSSSSGNEAVRVYAPGGASASWDGGITGAIRIKLPQRANNTMWSMKVRIYNYSTNQVSEYTMGNYSYDQGGYNASAHFIGASSAPIHNVRFGNQDGVDCVWIGETGTSWSYPVVSVISFEGGFRQGNATTWDDGWNITYVTSFGTVATTLSPAVKFGDVYASSLYDAGSRVAISRGEGRNFVDYSRYVYNNGAYSGVGWTEPSDLGVRYASNADMVDGLHASQFVRSDVNTVSIARHLEANTVWGSCGCLTLFLGWSSGKVLLGNGNTGAHDWANERGSNTIVSNNDHYFFNNVLAREDVIAYWSDARLKTNIKPIDNALDKINKIGGYFYTPNELAVELNATNDMSERVGVMAQEIEAILPHVVKPAPFNENYKTVQYEKLVPLLIQGIKEQQQQIEELKAEVKKLKEE